MHLGNGLLGIGQVHQAKSAQHGREGVVAEREFFGIHAFEDDIVDLEGAGGFTRDRDHLLGDVRAGDLAAGRDEGGGAKGDESRAAGDVEDLLAGRQLGHVEQGRLCRIELGLPRTLIVRRGLIPAVALHPLLQPRVHAAS